MIEIDRFYNAALANPTTTAEDFREQADAAKNPQRVRRAGSTDERERDDSRAPRDALNASISGVQQQSLPQAEVQAIKTKLGVGNVTRENSGRPLETRTVREAGEAMKDLNAVDLAISALLNEITPKNETPQGGVTPENETPNGYTSIKTPEEFRTALGNAIREVCTAIGHSYRETPPEGRTPEAQRRTLDMIRRIGDIGKERLNMAYLEALDFHRMFVDMIQLIGSVVAGGAILSAVASILKIAQAFLEAKWTTEEAETKQMTREAKERLEEMLEKLKQLVEDLKQKLRLLLARAAGERSLHGARTAGGLRAPASAEGLQLSSALLVQRRLEDVEKLVAGYERRLKERYAAGDEVKVG